MTSDQLVLVVVDVAAWGAIHASTGYLVHRLPSTRFDHDTALTRERGIESGGRLYTRVLRIRRWKPWLPEAGAFFAGGFDKRHLRGSRAADLTRFTTETRRAEVGHWLAAAAAPLFFLWNPAEIGAAMLVYAAVANGPCIAAQRYNRLRLVRVLRHLQESPRN